MLPEKHANLVNTTVRCFTTLGNRDTISKADKKKTIDGEGKICQSLNSLTFSLPKSVLNIHLFEASQWEEIGHELPRPQQWKNLKILGLVVNFRKRCILADFLDTQKKKIRMKSVLCHHPCLISHVHTAAGPSPENVKTSVCNFLPGYWLFFNWWSRSQQQKCDLIWFSLATDMATTWRKYFFYMKVLHIFYTICDNKLILKERMSIFFAQLCAKKIYLLKHKIDHFKFEMCGHLKIVFLLLVFVRRLSPPRNETNARRLPLLYLQGKSQEWSTKKWQ